MLALISWFAGFVNSCYHALLADPTAFPLMQFSEQYSLMVRLRHHFDSAGAPPYYFCDLAHVTATRLRWIYGVIDIYGATHPAYGAYSLLAPIGPASLGGVLF